MARYPGTITDQNGVPVAGARVLVQVSATGALADLTDDIGNPISNPLTTDQLGSFVFNVPGNIYDLTYQAAKGGRIIREAFGVLIGAPSLLPGAVVDSMGTSSVVAPSQRAVTEAVAPISILASTAARIFTGAANGSNVAALLQTMAQAGPVILPPGIYTIGTSITTPNLITFEPGARLAISNGVTLTASGGVSGPQFQQLFNLTGTAAVAGLIDVWATWFCGDAWNNPGRVDGRALAQKAYDACSQPIAGRAVVHWPAGFMKHDGTALTVTKGQTTAGAGNQATLFLWTTTATNGFRISGASGTNIYGMGCSWADYQIIPASGAFIEVVGGFLNNFEDIFVGVAWNGLNANTKSAGQYVLNSKFYECFGSGITVNNVGDVFVHNGAIASGLTYLQVAGVTGTFQIGESFVGYAAPATIAGIFGNVIQVNGSGLFSGVITGAVSGATATVSACNVPHALGAVRQIDHCEAVVISNMEIIGGVYPVITNATSNTVNNRPAYNFFSNCYFDSSIAGLDCQKSVEIEFHSCWFSGPGGQAAHFANCDGFKFIGGKVTNTGGHGFVFENTATNWLIDGMSIRGNGTAAANTYSGVLVKAGTSKFTIKGCCGDDAGLGFGSQKYAVEIQGGASDRYTVAFNRFTSTQIFDGGTGTNKFVGNNF